MTEETKIYNTVRGKYKFDSYFLKDFECTQPGGRGRGRGAADSPQSREPATTHYSGLWGLIYPWPVFRVANFNW